MCLQFVSNTTESFARAYVLAVLHQRRLGRGATGVVFAGIEKPTAARVAVKVVRAAPRSTTLIQWEPVHARELSFLAKAASPHAVRVLDAFVSPGILVFVMEHMRNDVWALLKDQPSQTVDAEIAYALGHQTATGITLLHENAIVHRDLHAKNVLLSWEGGSTPSLGSKLVAKIADFDMARADVADGSAYDNRVGWTICPPELLFVLRRHAVARHAPNAQARFRCLGLEAMRRVGARLFAPVAARVASRCGEGRVNADSRNYATVAEPDEDRHPRPLPAKATPTARYSSGVVFVASQVPSCGSCVDLVLTCTLDGQRGRGYVRSCLCNAEH